ncbi:MAG: DNA replication/repair protein RecF [Clostridia bacterium]|nr:DNA replication/repair protein RecF [Clostridia bacterium]
MIIKELKLKNYRNIGQMQICPSGGINLFYGENAQGKTNIIEAVWLFTGCKSFRGAKDRELVRFQETKAKLSMLYNAGGDETADIEIETRRKAFAGGVPLPSPVQLMGGFNAVVFSPAHLTLVKNGPAERRKFLDTAICQLKPSYTGVLRAYNRALDQRNSLLKDIPYHSELMDTLDAWDARLCEAAAVMTKQRQAYTARLANAAAEIYDGLSSGAEKFSVRYALSYDESAGDFAENLRRARKTDVINGTTSVGPHRDDLEIEINGISARSYGSQGQQRSAALAVKMAEGEILKDVTGEYPVLLLDDVMSELDAGRQNYILNHIEGRQVFITCCDPDAVKRAAVGAKFHIKNGKILN